jgi:hypothetical protein
MIPGAIFLTAYCAFVAWRYSRMAPDADWALFNLAGFTGAWYGRDFADCKSPGVHVWFWGLATVVGADIRRVRFAHHLLVGLPGVAYTLATGDLAGGLAFCVLVNAGWLWSFTGNVGQVPAGLILLGMAFPQAAPWLWGLAVVYEPKLVVAYLPMAWFYGWGWQTGVLAGLAGVGAGGVYLLRREVWEWLVEANVTIPRRMNQKRKGLYGWSPWFTSQALVYLLPWMLLAVFSRPDWHFWLAPAAFLIFSSLGFVLRPHHFLPLAAWIAGAGIAPVGAVCLASVDWVSSGLYLGDLWMRFYQGMRESAMISKKVGEWLKDKPGVVWVNSAMHTPIYLWAERKPRYGLVEQVEINAAATERRAAMKALWQLNPPDWVVESREPTMITFDKKGYEQVMRTASDSIQVWKRATRK